MIKTGCLVLFRLAQSCVFYVKLDSSWCKIDSAFRPGSINQSLSSINRKSSKMHFSIEFQLSPSSLKRLGFYVFILGIYGKPYPRFRGCSYGSLCKSLMRSMRSFPLHKLRVIKRRFIQELDNHSVAVIRA